MRASVALSLCLLAGLWAENIPLAAALTVAATVLTFGPEWLKRRAGKKGKKRAAQVPETPRAAGRKRP